MGTVTHLRPTTDKAGADRLLGDVRQAVATGTDLGDRRGEMRDLTNDLWRNYARLQRAIAALRTCGGDQDPEVARRIRFCEQLCNELMERLSPVLQQADRLNALLAPAAVRVLSQEVRSLDRLV